jgi:hypothetical protein
MNKRIQELIDQCTEKTPSTEWDGEYWINFNKEKFAQLIMAECIEQGKLIQSQKMINESKEYVAGREMGIEVFINQIRKHLGTQE